LTTKKCGNKISNVSLMNQKIVFVSLGVPLWDDFFMQFQTFVSSNMFPCHDVVVAVHKWTPETQRWVTEASSGWVIIVANVLGANQHLKKPRTLPKEPILQAFQNEIPSSYQHHLGGAKIDSINQKEGDATSGLAISVAMTLNWHWFPLLTIVCSSTKIIVVFIAIFSPICLKKQTTNAILALTRSSNAIVMALIGKEQMIFSLIIDCIWQWAFSAESTWLMSCLSLLC